MFFLEFQFICNYFTPKFDLYEYSNTHTRNSISRGRRSQYECGNDVIAF